MKKLMGINAFYDLMPEWFIIGGVIIATTGGYHCEPGDGIRCFHAYQ
ncbi:MAG: hypothetical protein WDN26_04455 [Chitinophagaceae bacterium]